MVVVMEVKQEQQQHRTPQLAQTVWNTTNFIKSPPFKIQNTCNSLYTAHVHVDRCRRCTITIDQGGVWPVTCSNNKPPLQNFGSTLTNFLAAYYITHTHLCTQGYPHPWQHHSNQIRSHRRHTMDQLDMYTCARRFVCDHLPL